MRPYIGQYLRAERAISSEMLNDDVNEAMVRLNVVIVMLEGSMMRRAKKRTSLDVTE